jgi:3-oxoacyl-[acyl-carrier-protein] synthase II
MGRSVAVTGLGAITPLGSSPEHIRERIDRGDRVARQPTRFDARPFACPLCAEIADFDPARHVPEPKTLRLMGRDAVLAAAAARRAMADAGVTVGADYAPEQIALFGATGLAGMPLSEVVGLIRHSAGPGGTFDAKRLGLIGIKRVRPVLSFRILSNMPVCLVSIFERIQGPNGVYNPWEGQGAQAVAAGIRAIQRGDAACALVGGCDAKAHELAFISLQQQGVFESWRQHGSGCVPGEGAAFLVLEAEDLARARGADIYARIAGHGVRTANDGRHRAAVYSKLLSALRPVSVAALVSAGDGDMALRAAEQDALGDLGLTPETVIRPKAHLGNLFAAAAPVQMVLGAWLAQRGGPGRRTLVDCFGYGSEQAAFLLEAP